MKPIEPGRSDGTVTRVEALGYRSLRYVSQSLSPFHVLVGPNASGKSTFLDVVAFLGDMVRAGVAAAVQGDPRFQIPMRAPDGRQLTWMRNRNRFEVAVELAIPAGRRPGLKDGSSDACRYEVAIDVTGPLRIVAETLWLKPGTSTSVPSPPKQRILFPQPPAPPDGIVRAPRKQAPKGWKKIVSRGDEPERVTFISETSGWNNPFRIEADKAALASLPEDEERFPVATWFRKLLGEGVQRLVLSSEDMRRPSPPGRSRGYLPDGSNLPHVVHGLESTHPDRFAQWIGHVREALPDVEGIKTQERDEDRHRYLVLTYRNGLQAPSWLVSDGTLRLLALTLLAYVPELSGLYLVEEPENGIHPRAVETIFQSLSTVYGAQVLLATHSPVVASMAELEQVLCFARTAEGATDIVRGSEHPRLRSWKGSIDIGTMLAAGVLS
ncbi:MAG: AAA family ATPase [Vicinamibacterales bacterium]